MTEEQDDFARLLDAVEDLAGKMMLMSVFLFIIVVALHFIVFGLVRRIDKLEQSAFPPEHQTSAKGSK